MKNPTTKVLILLGQKVAKHLASGDDDGDFQYPTLREIKKFLKMGGAAEGRLISNALYYLKKRKYIKILESAGLDPKIALTVLGTRQFLKYCPLTEKRFARRGSSNLVILSVPEEERHYRDFLRKKLLNEGFVLLNNGVYGTNQKLSPYLPFMVKILRLEKYVVWGEFRQSYKQRRT